MNRGTPARGVLSDSSAGGGSGARRSELEGMEQPHATARSGRVSTPQIECRGCRLPILLTSVERDGDRRSLTCPYCEQHDEWAVTTGS